MCTTDYIISQIFAILFIIFFGLTFFVKNKKILLILNIAANVFLGIEYFFLKAYTGMINSFISIIATLWFLINEKLNRKKDLISLCAISLIYLLFGIVSYSSWVDIFIMAASIGFNYAIWQDKIYIYRIIGVLVSSFWLIYDIFYFAIIQILSDITLLTIKCIGLIKFVIDSIKLKKEKQT